MTCSTCHVNNVLSNSTSYGCHEHTPSNNRKEHEEEGIRNFGNCVDCHRSTDNEGGEHREVAGMMTIDSETLSYKLFSLQ